MSTPKVILEAKVNGKKVSGTYKFWSDLTGSPITTIQKRICTRRKQIDEGYECPYTMEEVVGLVKLKNGAKRLGKKKATVE